MHIRRPKRLEQRAARLLAATLVALLATGAVGSIASAKHGDPNPPTTPANVVVKDVTQTTISLAWDAAQDDVGVVGYVFSIGGHRVLTTTTPLTKATLTNLGCGTSYQISLQALDAAGNRSKPALFVVATSACTDARPPSAPGGIQQLASTDSTATLGWSASTDDTLVAGYRLFRGTAVVGTTQLTSYTFTGLPCGSSVQVGIEAYDLAGNASSRPQFYVNTRVCPDSTPPTAPSSLRQTGATRSSVSVVWSPSSDTSGVAGYEVTANAAAEGTTTSTSYHVLNLSCGHAYTVGVAAFDPAGNDSATSSVVTSTSACSAGTPAPTDTQAPSSPSGLSVSSADQTSVSLAWQPSSDNVGVAGYGVYRGTTLAGTTGATGYTVAGLSCGTSYQLAVDAYDAAANRSAATTVVAATSACTTPPPGQPPVDTTPPTAPSQVVQLGRTDTSITISWAVSSDDVGVAGYRLFQNGADVGTTTQNSYTFASLWCGTAYTFGVNAFDAAGNHSPQAVVSMTTASCADTTPPPAPTGLKSSNVSQTSATLTWTASSGAAGYDVYVGGAAAGTTKQTSYVLNALTCGTSYALSIDAYDANANRSLQTSVTVTTSACSGSNPPLSAANVYLSTGGNDSTCVRGDAGKPCRTFQRAYDIAQGGDTIAVAGGSYPANDTGRNSVTVFGGPKSSTAPVTFTCAGGTVDFSAAWFTIKAYHVRVSGSCFRVHAMRFGEPGDNSLTTQDVTVDGMHMDGVEIVGAQQITLDNVEIGPNVICAAQGSSSSSSTWCNPGGPSYESFYASTGDTSLPMEPYIHNNQGGVRGIVTIENSYVHDIQTKDANAWHTGCFLVWQDGGAPGDVTFQNNRFERCAVNGILVDQADGLTVVSNWFGPPSEPFSNTGGAQQTAPDFAKELIFKGSGEARDWLVKGNTFCHGTRSGGSTTTSNVRFESNDLGPADAPWPGATYVSNTSVGASC